VERVAREPESSDSALSRLDARFLHLGVTAARAAVADAGLGPMTDEQRERVAVVVGSAFGGLDLLETERLAIQRRKTLATSPYLIPGMIINQAAGQIAQQFRLYGPSVAPANACATGGHALSLGAEMIRAGAADLAICGATESAFTPEVVNGFSTMRALIGRKPGDRSLEDPAQASRPFSLDRAGFVLSEGAAIVILAGESAVRAMDLCPQAELIGWASNSDGFHMAMPDPRRIARCLEMALSSAGQRPDQIDYYNAHGTSTVVNDRTETEAIKLAFGPAAKRLQVSSIKGALGHSLGAASAIEAAVCVRCLLEQVIPPTINHIPDPELDLDYVPNEARRTPIATVMSASFGFGGTNNVVVFRRCANG
jgi:3-oxoacyl-[acyl-carrier-protein] synthase II